MVQVDWTEEAIDSIELIRRYVSLFNPNAADRLASDITAAAASLSDFPDRGRPVGGGKRELPSVPPYVIRYKVSGDRVEILSIRHGRRRPLPS